MNKEIQEYEDLENTTEAFRLTDIFNKYSVFEKAWEKVQKDGTLMTCIGGSKEIFRKEHDYYYEYLKSISIRMNYYLQELVDKKSKIANEAWEGHTELGTLNLDRLLKFA